MTKMKGGPADTGGPVEVPEQLSILPLRNSVLFPGSIIPIDVGRRKSVRLVEEAISKERPVIGILTQRDARTEDPTEGDMYQVGCAARILKVIKLAKDNFSVILQGVSRIRIAEYNQQEPFITARVQSIPDPTTTDVELDALVMSLRDIAKHVIKLMPELPKEASALIDSVTEPGPLADLIASNLDVQVDEKQDVLETFDVKARIRKVLQLLTRQLEILKMRERINSQIKEEMGSNQREYVLRQQLKAIKEELGEHDEAGGDLDGFEEKVQEAKMPPEAEKVAKKQLKRLKVMQRRRRSTRSRAPTSSGSSSCRGPSRPRTSSTSRKRATSSTRTTTASRRSRSASSSTSRCASSRATRRGRSCASSDRRAWARPRSGARSPGRWGASSCASRSAACTTRPRSAATGAPTSARCPGRSSRG